MTLRRALKIAVFAVAAVLTLPLVAAARIEQAVSRSEAVFTGLGQLLALVPGAIGTYLRAAFFFGTLESCSWETHIGFGTLFTHRGARIARRFSTGAYCVIGHAAIGEGVRIASRVSVPSGKRQHLDDEGRMTDGTQFERVTIGAGCWIGEAAVVLADVGPGCIVSAGAVVIEPVGAGVLVGGNPARVIKTLSAAAVPAAAGGGG